MTRLYSDAASNRTYLNFSAGFKDFDAVFDMKEPVSTTATDGDAYLESSRAHIQSFPSHVVFVCVSRPHRFVEPSMRKQEDRPPLSTAPPQGLEVHIENNTDQMTNQ